MSSSSFEVGDRVVKFIFTIVLKIKDPSDKVFPEAISHKSHVENNLYFLLQPVHSEQEIAKYALSGRTMETRIFRKNLTVCCRMEASKQSLYFTFAKKAEKFGGKQKHCIEQWARDNYLRKKNWSECTDLFVRQKGKFMFQPFPNVFV
jgi:hypothetical protein